MVSVTATARGTPARMSRSVSGMCTWANKRATRKELSTGATTRTPATMTISAATATSTRSSQGSEL